MDLQNANVEQVSDQIEELIGYRPLHKVCISILCVRVYVCMHMCVCVACMCVRVRV